MPTVDPSELSRVPVCKDIEIPNYGICNHSDYADWAIKNHKAGYWCSMVCYGEYRLYKVNDGEYSWVWAKSKEQITEHWKQDYDAEPDKIDVISYGEATATMITCEDGGKKNLLNIVHNDYKDAKELEVIASTVW